MPVLRPNTFQFYACLILQEATGLRAATLPQLLQLMRTASERSIYHHTHACLLAQPGISSPVNDFAAWVRDNLGEESLVQALAAVSPFSHQKLGTLRDAFVGLLERHLEAHPASKLAFVPQGREFAFLESIRVVIPTRWRAATLEELSQALTCASPHVLFCHLVDARWRLREPANDLAAWMAQLATSEAVAEQVAALNPYALGLEESRRSVLALLKSDPTSVPA